MGTIQLLLESGPYEPPIDQGQLSELSKRSLRQYLHGQNGTLEVAKINELWLRLFSNAMSQSSSEKYLTAVCNCVSVFLLSAATSPLVEVKQFSTSERVWFEGFQCAQKAFDGGKTKPALQVLETLAQLLSKHPDKAAASKLLHQSSQGQLKVLFTGCHSRQIKTACIVITCLVKKTDLLSTIENSVAEILKQVSFPWKEHQLYNGVLIGDSPDQQSSCRHLFLALLFAVRNLETRSAALKVFTILLQADNWTRDSSPAQSAADVIENFIKQDTESIGDFAENIIPVILDDKSRYQMFCNLYKPDRACSQSRLILYLAVLKAGRLKRFLSEADLPRKVDEAVTRSSKHDQDQNDPYLSFRLLLRSGSSDVRIHAYSLLTANFGTTTAIPRDVLQCLLSSLKCLYDNNDAYERGEVISITRRLLRRLESSRGNIQKTGTFSSSIVKDNTLKDYDDFLRKFSMFLLRELDPGLSYQRHILALQTLQLLLGTVPDVWLDQVALAMSLSSLLLDPFNDVRSTAYLLLKEVVKLDSEATMDAVVPKLLDDTEILSARTCRHDHADAAGRLWPIVRSQIHNAGDAHNAISKLLLRLDEKIKSTDPVSPASDYPLHATLLGFAYILGARFERIESMCTDLVRICQKIWAKVQPQLCVDSPETETDDAESEGNSGPKDMLAYSWRALRDSSVLLQSILRVCPEDSDILAQIGWLCIEQLTLLRHRGAFSTVAQTFSLCCEKVRTAQSTSTRQLNNKWYKAALHEIEKQSTKLTRRSAGLPAMVCAILSSTDVELFGQVYLDLKVLASQPVILAPRDQSEARLPQVHALNCLKDIITNSKFRTCTEQYQGEMLELAADRLSSPTWAVRNCGLMLFRACINRLDSQAPQLTRESLGLVGTVDSRRKLVAIATGLLIPGDNDVAESPLRSEVVFAALDLAKHVGVSDADAFELIELIYIQLGSTVWAIRDHAARVLASHIISRYNNRYDALHAVSNLSSSCPNNLLHGIMILYRYILESPLQDGERKTGLNLLQNESRFMKIIVELCESGCSPYITAAWLDVANRLVLHTLTSGNGRDSSTEALKTLRMKIRRNQPSNWFCHSRFLLNEVLCFLVRSRYRQMSEAVDDTLLDNLTQDPDATRFILEYIQNMSISNTPGLVDLLIRLIVTVQATHSQALAMKSLVEYVELGGIDFSDKHAASIAPVLERLGSDNPTLWNARLRLEGFLIRTQLLRLETLQPHQLTHRLKPWLYMITMASKDQLDFPTRYNSAVALRHCGSSLVERLEQERTDQSNELNLRVLLLTYDQLSDDDEEIRKIAEETASKILQGTELISGLAIPACALVARKSLLELLVDRYGSGAELPKLALARLVGESKDEIPDLHVSPHSLFQESVSELLAQTRANMNDLFVEERQNLYVDDLNEIGEWSQVLGQCEGSQLDSKWYMAAVHWCEDGLGAMRSLLRSEIERKRLENGLTEPPASFHPLGPTYNPEVLVLFLRVVKLASALIALAEKYGSRDIDMVEEATGLRQEITAFRDAAFRAGAHRRVIEALGVTPGSEQD